MTRSLKHVRRTAAHQRDSLFFSLHDKLWVSCQGYSTVQQQYCTAIQQRLYINKDHMKT